MTGSDIRAVQATSSPVAPVARLTDVQCESFWKRVDRSTPDGCWPWIGMVQSDGYGILHVNRKTLRAHRVAYWISTGTHPGPLHVCHKCDHPPCCNPAHLFLGDVYDNMADMVAKGRNWTGGNTSGRGRGNRRPIREIDGRPTDRQISILCVIHEFVLANDMPPTLRELSELTGIRSTNGINDHLRGLQARGLIATKPLISRSLRITEAGMQILREAA
jgi:hypothetical protein